MNLPSFFINLFISEHSDNIELHTYASLSISPLLSIQTFERTFNNLAHLIDIPKFFVAKSLIYRLYCITNMVIKAMERENNVEVMQGMATTVSDTLPDSIFNLEQSIIAVNILRISVNTCRSRNESHLYRIPLARVKMPVLSP